MPPIPSVAVHVASEASNTKLPAVQSTIDYGNTSLDMDKRVGLKKIQTKNDNRIFTKKQDVNSSQGSLHEFGAISPIGSPDSNLPQPTRTKLTKTLNTI